MLVFLQHEKDRMQRQIELLKHNINALLEISKLSIEDLEKLVCIFQPQPEQAPFECGPQVV